MCTFNNDRVRLEMPRSTHAALVLALILIMGAQVSAQEPAKEDAAPSAPGQEESANTETPPEAQTGYICGMDIFYQWEVRFPVDARERTRNDPAPKTYETYYSRAEESGQKKEDVIQTLAARRPLYESNALEHCRDERQTLTNCVAHKLREIEQDYARADYASRSALLQSVLGDCRGTQGVCTKARIGEITCKPLPVVAAPPAESTPAPKK